MINGFQGSGEFDKIHKLNWKEDFSDPLKGYLYNAEPFKLLFNRLYKLDGFYEWDDYINTIL